MFKFNLTRLIPFFSVLSPQLPSPAPCIHSSLNMSYLTPAAITDILLDFDNQVRGGLNDGNIGQVMGAIAKELVSTMCSREK